MLYNAVGYILIYIRMPGDLIGLSCPRLAVLIVLFTMLYKDAALFFQFFDQYAVFHARTFKVPALFSIFASCSSL